MKHQLLRLHQFVAVHRDLLRPLAEWLAARRNPEATVSLTEWVAFPAGYATDTTYDDVLTYLLATGELRQRSTEILLPTDADTGFLWTALKRIESEHLFSAEQNALVALKSMNIKLTELK